MKQINKIIMLLILVSMINTVNAIPLLNQSQTTVIETPQLTFFSQPYSLYGIGGLTVTVSHQINRTKLMYDFTNSKYLQNAIIPMRAGDGFLNSNGCGGWTDKVLYPSSIESGVTLDERIIPAIYYINSTIYGYGSFGYTRYGENNITSYWVIINSYPNSTFVDSLTGKQNITIIYDQTIFSNISWSQTYATDNSWLCNGQTRGDNPTLSVIGIWGWNNFTGGAVETFTNSISTVNISLANKSIWRNYWEYWKDLNNYTTWINVNKNTSNTQTIIKRNENVIYNTTNSIDINNFYMSITNDLILSFKNMANGLWYNFTLEGSIPISDYSITFNKSSYNLNEDVSLYVNISNFDSNSNYILKFYQETLTGNYDIFIVDYPLTSSINLMKPSMDKTKMSTLYAIILKSNAGCFGTCEGVVFTSLAIPYGTVVNISSAIGNISLDKTQYSLNENINIKYNLSVNGRIAVYCNNIIYAETVNSGIEQQTDYTVSQLQLLPCQVRLQYFYLNDWITLDYKIFETISGIDNVFFSQQYANLGDTLNVYYNSIDNRYLILVDSNGNIKFNYSIPISQYGLSKTYILTSSDLTGIYTAYLNYTNNTNIASATIIINDAIIVTPQPTISSSQPISLLDIGNALSEVVVGKQTDENGIVSDIQIKKTGNSIYGLLLAVVFICLMSGTYYTLINKKRR